MVAIRWTVAVASLASAFIALPALAQSTASLTHTVSVTVPPRVHAQLTSPTEQRGVSISPAAGKAVNISVSATRSWALSIASRGAGSLQWSSLPDAGFSQVGRQERTIATGQLAAVPTASTLFVRTSEKVGGSGELGEVEAVVLTMVAP